ncbi:MAG: hypothetical protein GVY22_16290 [Gammaproteobacteria bacterium]|jgi:hypothetical protein|nr:hypothetical protein [Gammaproteobacteria bacterium]
MKMCFARSKTATAIAAVLAAAASPSALAVNHSDDGLGEVGLIPYYTVRGGFDTNIAVTNTSDRYVVAFKIRFREGANSRDARDFNVYLSPNDVWTATVSMGADEETPYIQTADTTCTAPWIGTNRSSSFVQVGTTADGRPIKQLDFTNIDYNGGTIAGDDPGIDSIERAQEGYVEIIELGVADPAASQLADWAVHGGAQNCRALANVYSDPPTQFITVTGSGLGCEVGSGAAVGQSQTGNVAFQAEYCEPLNVLKVDANLISVDSGVASGMPVYTLANFYNPTGSEDPNAPAPQDISDAPVNPTPNLTFAEPAASLQINNGVVVQDAFVPNTADAVSSLFSATEVINEYALGGAALAQTAWVVTFPTKNFYVDGVNPASPPFQVPFTAAGSAVTVEYEYYDREEGEPIDPIVGEVLPSPQPIVPPPETDVISWESQTLNFIEGGNLFDSQHNYVIELADGFNSGWLRLGFPNARSITGLGGTIYNGLPTIGFAMKTLENGVVEAARLNYGIVTPHAYTRDIR